MKICNKTTLEEILKQPWVAGWEFMIDPETPSLSLNLPLEQIPLVFPTWNASSIVTGLNYLQEKARKGRVFYHIWNEDERKKDPSKERVGLTAFPCAGSELFFLICPGGGYSSVCSIAEGFPIAMRLNELGFGAFVLQYRVGKDAAGGRPLEDLAAAVRFLEEHSKEFGLETMDYVLVGFSAGGHLAGMFGTETQGAAAFGVQASKGMMLGYPVATMGGDAHLRSRLLFLGENPDEDMVRRYSLEKQITPAYPPSFVWQCREDDTVPSVNSRMIVDALRRQNVPCEYELFDGDAHGWGIGMGTPADGWLERAVQFVIGSMN